MDLGRFRQLPQSLAALRRRDLHGEGDRGVSPATRLSARMPERFRFGQPGSDVLAPDSKGAATLTVSPIAAEALDNLLQNPEVRGDDRLRIGTASESDFGIEICPEPASGDQVIEEGGARVFVVDREAAPTREGVELQPQRENSQRKGQESRTAARRGLDHAGPGGGARTVVRAGTVCSRRYSKASMSCGFAVH